MKKVTEFRICNLSLLCLTILMLASGLQLEINPLGERIWVWLHIWIGVIFFVDIFWHLKLHKSPRSSRAHGKGVHWLGCFFVLAFVSGVVATIHWLGTFCHSTIGGIHGKLGFVMIIAVIIHVRNHVNFYKRAF